MFTNLQSFRLTNCQAQSYLKKFMLYNCRHTPSFDSFEYEIDEHIKDLQNNDARYDTLMTDFKKVRNSFEQIVFLDFMSKISHQTKFFVLTSDNSYFNTLIELIKEHMPTLDIKIKWNTNTEDYLNVIYDKHIIMDPRSSLFQNHSSQKSQTESELQITISRGQRTSQRN